MKLPKYVRKEFENGKTVVTPRMNLRTERKEALIYTIRWTGETQVGGMKFGVVTLQATRFDTFDIYDKAKWNVVFDLWGGGIFVA